MEGQPGGDYAATHIWTSVRLSPLLPSQVVVITHREVRLFCYPQAGLWAVATLVSDRSAPFYVLSVYLHPDQVKKEIEDIPNAWRNVEKKSDKIVIAGGFNQADVKCPLLWKRWLTTFKVMDVHPSLATYLHAGGTSALDRSRDV